MSRIGKRAIKIPSDIKVEIKGGLLSFEKGKLKKELDTKNHVNVSFENSELSFAPKGEEKTDRAFWGTYRSLASNIVEGLDKGFTKVLELNGVGYRAAVNGKNLEMNLGFSHPVIFPAPEGIEISVDKNQIIIKSADRQLLGQVAADIRAFRPPEPYKGKGIKYQDEKIVRKAGKTSKK